MKEQIHTIPINDALDNAGECLFCYIERRTEEHVMNFVLGHGASYMEADIREMTDKEGFCRAHFKKMFDYGNSLGNAWILKTHYRRIIDEMNKEFKNFKPGKPAKKGLFAKPSASDENNSIVSWIKEKECSCYICNNVQNSFNAYLKTNKVRAMEFLAGRLACKEAYLKAVGVGSYEGVPLPDLSIYKDENGVYQIGTGAELAQSDEVRKAYLGG